MSKLWLKNGKLILVGGKLALCDDDFWCDCEGSESSASESSGSGSSGSETSGSEPSGSEPSGSEPSGSEPSGSQPSGSEPSESEPSGSEPSGSEPSGSQPSGSEPSGSQPSGSEPGGSSQSSESSESESSSSSDSNIGDECGCCEDGTTPEKFYVRVGFSGVGEIACSEQCGPWWQSNRDWELTQQSNEYPCAYMSDTRLGYPCYGGPAIQMALSLMCQPESEPGANDGFVVIMCSVIAIMDIDDYVVIQGSGKLDCDNIGQISFGNENGPCQLLGVTLDISTSPFP